MTIVDPARALLDDLATREAVGACRAITRSRAANFYWGLRLTPEPKRSAMYAVYAWMRAADDLVDGLEGAGAATGTAGAARAIDEFRAMTVAALAGKNVDGTSLWLALAAVGRAYPLDIRDFHSMLDGQVADLGPRAIEDWSQLEGYCKQVASTVGRVCIEVWGYSDPRALDLATERGIAFQLTNIIRDLREDISLGRTYVPKSLLDSAGITIDGLCEWRPDGPAARVVGELIERARCRYEASDGLEGMIEPACRPTLWALTQIYRELLERIARDPRAVVQGRVALPVHRKVMIALRARLRGSSA